MMENAIVVYGTTWCGDCSRVRTFFDKNHIQYVWVNIDNNEAAEEFVYATNHGMRSVPTILFPDGSIIVEPSDNKLKQLLGSPLLSY
jgi:mycoredoxin